MLDISIREFTELAASKDPVPGGGGVSALVGSLAASLAEMVTNLTVGKKKYAEYEEEILRIKEKAESLRKDLLECINGDAEAFEPLARAYSMDRSDPAYAETMEKCLQDAAASPLRILGLACQVVALDERLAEIGSKLAVSDAATSVMLAHGAIYGAKINVLVNTRLMKNRQIAQDIDMMAEDLVFEYAPRALKCYEAIEKRLSNG
jgi:formiminotetrahydrofolate cyclodeaminase